MAPQFGLCPVCWTVGAMALLSSIPLLGGLVKKFRGKAQDTGSQEKTAPPPAKSCGKTGDSFCHCADQKAS